MTTGEAFPPELPPTRRYTLSGETVFEQQVKQDLSRIAADAELSLLPHVRSLLLVGRFARGEGSVVDRKGEPVAFDAYQCIALADRLTEVNRSALSELEKTWSAHLKVPVQIHPCACNRLGRPHDTLWWLDIGRGNVEVLSGDPMTLSTLQSVEQHGLRPDEATWLLCEHATLVALALHVPGTPLLQRRYRIHTLALACGDAELILAGRFAGGLRARLGQLQGLSPGARADAVAAAIEFLSRPDLWQVDDEAQWERATLQTLGSWHMDLEHRRQRTPNDVHAFVRHRGEIFERDERRRGWLSVGKRVLSDLMVGPLPFPYVDDPLERLVRAAVGLAYRPKDASVRMMCARLLGFAGGPVASDGDLALQLSVMYSAARATRDDPVSANFYV